MAYTSELPPSQTSLLLSGLHGDKMYDLHLEVYSTEHAFLPLKSNTTVRNNYIQTIPVFPFHVTFTCACVTFLFQRIKIDDSTLTGAPLISFESCGDVTSLCIVWRHVSLPENPIDSYILYLNHQQCGDKVRPDRDSDRCKVVVSGCHVDTPYHVVVGALREGE